MNGRWANNLLTGSRESSLPACWAGVAGWPLPRRATYTGWGLLTTRRVSCLPDQTKKKKATSCTSGASEMGRGWKVPAVHVCYHSDPYMIDGLCALELELGWTWNVSLETASVAWERLRFMVGRGQPWALPNHDQNWSWATTLSPFLGNSGWVVLGLVYSPR